MNGSPLPMAAKARPPGVIDTLQAGFSLINRNAWLLTFPAFVELIIWLGPQLVIGPLIERFLLDAAALPGLDSGVSRSMEEARRSSQQLLGEQSAYERFNVLLALSLPLRLLTPAFVFDVPQNAVGPTYLLPSLGIAALTLLGALIVGVAVAAIYLGLLAHAVREGQASPQAVRTVFWGAFLHVGGLVLILFVCLVGIVMPIEALLAIFARTSPMAASIIGPLILGLLIWLFVYLFFTVPAMFVSGVGPVTGARLSMQVVRRNLWSSTGLIVLAIVISAGLSIIWTELAQWATNQTGVAPVVRGLGVAVAVGGHIYITGGLVAACMTYYKERHQATHPQTSMAQPASGA